MQHSRGALARERVRGTFAYLEHPALIGRPGLEQIKRMLRREVPPPPLWYVSGLDVVEAGLGVATYRLPATGWLRSPAGFPTPGVIAFAADAALGGALYTTLQPNTFVLTANLTLDMIGVPLPGCGAFLATGRVIRGTHDQGLTEATVTDAAGRYLAHATSRCIAVRLPEPIPQVPMNEGLDWPDYESPHPFQRSPEGDVVPHEIWDRMSGLEMLRAWRDGHLPRTPLSNFTGSLVIDAEPGQCTLAIPASRWFASHSGMLYGGAMALFADYAMNGAVQSTVEAGTSWGPLDLKINYLRPVVCDGRELEVRAKVVHRGSTIAVATSEAVDSDGKLVALAGSTHMIWPGRAWAAMSTIPWPEDLAIDDSPTRPFTGPDRRMTRDGLGSRPLATAVPSTERDTTCATL